MTDDEKQSLLARIRELRPQLAAAEAVSEAFHRLLAGLESQTADALGISVADLRGMTERMVS